MKLTEECIIGVDRSTTCTGVGKTNRTLNVRCMTLPSSK